jgi:predicted transglutaminase-like cysteine proteinase
VQLDFGTNASPAKSTKFPATQPRNQQQSKIRLISCNLWPIAAETSLIANLQLSMPLTQTKFDYWHHCTVFLIATLVVLIACRTSLADTFPVSSQLLDKTIQKPATFAHERIATWGKLISHYKNADSLQKLHVVNSFFNKMKFVNDMDLWGKEDYWATPLQMLTSNGGDCEDYSIAKYFTLRKMGVPAERMRLTYVKAVELNQAHMVLAYYSTPNAVPLILDNLINDIQTASHRNDLQPVYSFNSTDLWLVKQRGGDQLIGRAGRLSRWQEVIARINSEQLSVPR